SEESGPVAGAATGGCGVEVLTALEIVVSNVNMMRLRSAKQVLNVSGDDEFFVRRDHADGRGALRCGDDVGIRGVSFRIQSDPEVSQSWTDAVANGRRVFADTAGEHHRIDAVEDSGQRAHVFATRVTEEVDGLPGGRCARIEQHADITAEARHSEKAR